MDQSQPQSPQKAPYRQNHGTTVTADAQGIILHYWTEFQQQSKKLEVSLAIGP
jgi:hypothetical protein